MVARCVNSLATFLAWYLRFQQAEHAHRSSGRRTEKRNRRELLLEKTVWERERGYPASTQVAHCVSIAWRWRRNSTSKSCWILLILAAVTLEFTWGLRRRRPRGHHLLVGNSSEFQRFCPAKVDFLAEWLQRVSQGMHPHKNSVEGRLARTGACASASRPSPAWRQVEISRIFQRARLKKKVGQFQPASLDFCSKCDARMAAVEVWLEDAHTCRQGAHVILEAHVCNDYDRLLALENTVAQLKETVRSHGGNISHWTECSGCFVSASEYRCFNSFSLAFRPIDRPFLQCFLSDAFGLHAARRFDGHGALRQVATLESGYFAGNRARCIHMAQVEHAPTFAEQNRWNSEDLQTSERCPRGLRRQKPHGGRGDSF